MLQLPDISGAIRMDLNPLKQALSQAAGDAHAFSAETKGDLNQIATLDTGGFSAGLGAITTGAAVAGASIAAALAGAGAFVGNAFHDALDIAGDLHDLAANIGVGAEALSGLGLAAKSAGASTEDVADAYKFLGKNIGEAMNGSKDAIAAFSRFGIAFSDAAGNARPLEAVMFDIADALEKLPPGAARTTAAMALLERGGVRMIGTLSQGSDALKEQIEHHKQLGAVITQSAADSADAFGDMLAEFDSAWTGIKLTIGQPLIEGLTAPLEEMLNWTRDHMPDIRNAILDAMQGAAVGIDALANSVNESIAVFHEFRAAVLNLMPGGEDASSKQKDIEDLQAQRDAPGNSPAQRKKIQDNIDRLQRERESAIASGNVGEVAKELSAADAARKRIGTTHVGDAFKDVRSNMGVDAALNDFFKPIEDAGKSSFSKIDSVLDDFFKPIEDAQHDMETRIDFALDKFFEPIEKMKEPAFKAEKLPDQPKFAEFIRGDTADAFRFDQGRNSGEDTAKAQLGVQQKMLRALEQANRNQPVVLKLG